MKTMNLYLVFIVIFFFSTKILAQNWPIETPPNGEPPPFGGSGSSFGTATCNTGIPSNGSFSNFTFPTTGNTCPPSKACAINVCSIVQTTATAPFQAPDCTPESQEWKASHGTPEIWRDAVGDKHALIWAGDFGENGNSNFGEGLFIKCLPFESGKSYTVNFKIGTPIVPSWLVDFQSNFIGTFQIYGCSSSDIIENKNISNLNTVDNNYIIPTVPTNNQLLFSLFSFSSPGILSNQTFSFVPWANFDVIWIRMTHPISHRICIALLDDFCIKCSEPEEYPPTIIACVHSYQCVVPELVCAQKIIGRNYVINNPPFTTKFYASKSITFERTSATTSHFEVTYGTNFIAEIRACDCVLFACKTGGSITGNPIERNSNEPFTIDENEVKLFPNPAHDEITLIPPLISEVNCIEFQIFNQLGEIKNSGKMYDSRQMNVDLGKFPEGLYIARFKSNGNVISTKKFFKI